MVKDIDDNSTINDSVNALIFFTISFIKTCKDTIKKIKIYVKSYSFLIYYDNKKLALRLIKTTDALKIFEYKTEINIRIEILILSKTQIQLIN